MDKYIAHHDYRSKPNDAPVLNWLASFTLQDIHWIERQLLIGALRHGRISDSQLDQMTAILRREGFRC
jgi:hypothetical protein